MIKELIKLANHLDSKGLSKEANALDGVIKRIAETQSPHQASATQTTWENTGFTAVLESFKRLAKSAFSELDQSGLAWEEELACRLSAPSAAPANTCTSSTH